MKITFSRAGRRGATCRLRPGQIPFGEWHLRLHRINSARTLQTVEGGFAVMKTAHQVRERGCYLMAENGSSVIVDLADHSAPARQHRHAAEQQHYVCGVRLHSAVKS